MGLKSFLKTTFNKNKYEKGLAYLNGYGVKADAEKGAKLISEAAAEGNYEAMRTLAVLYRKGIGVDKNYDMELMWLEKALKYCKENSKKSFKKAAPSYGEKLARIRRKNEILKDLKAYRKAK